MVAMIKVKKDVDKTFINLPSHARAKQLIANSQGIVDETKRLIEALAQVNQVTEKEIEDATKRIQEEKGKSISMIDAYLGISLETLQNLLRRNSFNLFSR